MMFEQVYFPCLVLIGLIIQCCLTGAQSKTVYNVSTNGTDDEDSCFKGVQPCKNLTTVLEHVSSSRMSNVVVNIESGQYMLESGIVFSTGGNAISVDNIMLIGNGLVEIYCSETQVGGLTFNDCMDITIQGLKFFGCGIEHNSTSLKFENGENEPHSFWLFNVTLYFENCHNINLQSLNITNSLGVAVQFYSTTGHNYITNCQFINNPYNAHNVGGGLYIDFSNCFPGDLSACSKKHSTAEAVIVSNSLYSISNCSFHGNNATMKVKDYQVLSFTMLYRLLGCGGGLSVSFKGSASTNRIIIEDCEWINNEANYGGGLYVEMRDNSSNNTVALSGHNVFTGNKATHSGGGALFNILFLKEFANVSGSNITISETTFEGNDAFEGGGMFFLSTRQPLQGNPNFLKFINCLWINNTAKLGSGLGLSVFHPVVGGIMHRVALANCSFLANSVQYLYEKHRGLGKGYVLGAGAMRSDGIPIFFNESIIFHDNYDETALVVLGTKIEVNERTSVEFINNTGHNGGAIGMYSSAFIKVYENTSFLFQNNSARNRGGAIYAIASGSFSKESMDCMVRYHNITLSPYKWLTSFTFIDNQAKNRPNSIYTSTIQSCTSFRTMSKDPLMSVFCWNDLGPAIWEYNYNTSQEQCKKHIQTDIASFNLTALRNPIHVTPGNQIKFDIQPLNDQDSEITEFVLHIYPSDPDSNAKVDETSDYFSADNIVLYKSSNDTHPDSMQAQIFVDAVQENIVQVHLEVQFKPCTAGFQLDDSTKPGHFECSCLGDFRRTVQCDPEKFTAAKLLNGYWIGPYKGIGPVVTGHCVNCHPSTSRSNLSHITLHSSLANVSNQLCGNYSEGILCNECYQNYSPTISYNDFKCVECTDAVDPKGLSLFVVLGLIIPILFLIFVFLSDVPLTVGLLHGPILVCQMVSTVITLDGENIIPYSSVFREADFVEKVYTSLYDFFNLYFGRSALNDVCLSRAIRHNATVIAIGYIPALMPLVIVIVIGLMYYCSRALCKCCLKCFNRQYELNFRGECSFIRRKKNKANFLATAILLSYTKIAVITCYLITPVQLITADGKHLCSVMYYDGTIDYLSKDHLPYFLLAVFFGVPFLVVVPTILFCYRSNNPKKNGGLFNHLLGQFQDEFRFNKTEYTYRGTCFDRNFSCRGHNLIDIRIDHKYACCTPTAVCSYFCNGKVTRIPVFCNMNWSRHDFRWVAAVLFILRLLIVLPYATAWNTLIQFVLQFTVCILYAIGVLLFHPYKRNKNESGIKKVDPNVIEASSMLLLALMIVLSIYQYSYTMTDISLSRWAYYVQAFVLVWIPLLWIVGAYFGLFYLQHKTSLCRLYDKVRRCFNRIPVGGNIQNRFAHDEANEGSLLLSSRTSSIGSEERAVTESQESHA